MMDPNTSNRLYPSLNERMSRIDEVASHLETPEGTSFVETELARKLKAEHDKLFGHHKHRE